MRLIFDIGSNNGDDIPYYLHKSDIVVALEANPNLCKILSKRFKSEIRDKRLFIENAVITDSNEEETNFYISKINHVISSIFPPSNKNLDNWEQIKIKTISCNDLLEKYGKPDYIKIDIEGADKMFLLQLHEAKYKPKYISTESHQLDILCILSEKFEYKSFKLVKGCSVSDTYRKKKIFSKYLNRNIYYNFPFHSAGPFGNDITGNWYDRDSLLILLAIEKLGWIDIHATTEFKGKHICFSKIIYIMGLAILKKRLAIVKNRFIKKFFGIKVLLLKSSVKF